LCELKATFSVVASNNTSTAWQAEWHRVKEENNSYIWQLCIVQGWTELQNIRINFEVLG